MNWIHVNFYQNNGPEIMDVRPMEHSKKNTSWLLLLMKLTSVCPYVPSGIQLLSYLLSKKNAERL